MIRDIALNSYYFVSLPSRWWLRHSLAREKKSPLCVLFYHRVADTHPNDWSMSTDCFQQQLDWMQSNIDLISLSDVQARMIDGNQRVAASITFDDGYAENCDFAIPLLLEREIPCTYFVSLDFVLHGRTFPHDEAHGQPLPANSIAQLRDMAAAGIEIGAHTRTHCDIGKVTDPESLFDEMVTATRELSELIGQPIRYFAFPYGLRENTNRIAAEMAKESGIQAVCSAYGAYCLPGEDPFHIQRIHADTEFSRFRNWLTIDPRKLSIGRDFEMPIVPMLEPANC